MFIGPLLYLVHYVVIYTICNVSGMLLMYGGKFPLVEKTNTNSKQFTHGNVDNLT